MDFIGTSIGEAREPGARRRKIAEFLKSANEARQNYFQGSDNDPWAGHGHGEENEPAFPDAAVIRGGGLEMIVFPSYAKQWTRPTHAHVSTSDGNDSDYWRREWAKHEDSKGVVEVDIRGWIYTPQRGPATRRQRLMIGLARQLSGIAAPPTSGSNGSSQRPSRTTSPERTSKQEEDLIQFEADQIVQKGRIEAEFARRGVFSEQPGRGGNETGTFAPHNRSESADTSRSQRYGSYSSEDSGNITPVQKRDSWAPPAKMSAAELTVANRHLLHRLRPFMATPLVESQVKAFFYNDTTSRQKSVFTNPSGHFSLRTTLDFVPTHVRVVAGSDLSITEQVSITAPTGVSLISDIDDTIKHSAISMGAREIFRNAFLRDLGDLTIEGVREWYTRLNQLGVQFHYVSNSPWQMYPVLTSFFKIAGLPRGSFHLKQYSGMLQGIFEPVAERKKGNLDRIMRDFPSRKFILVGDSGEADLEVYTEVVLEHPGRILGVFIRDVTTTSKSSGFFDSSGGSPGRRSRRSSKSSDGFFMSKRFSRANDSADEDADLQAAIAASLTDAETAASKGYSETRGQRPRLPSRAPSSPLARAQTSASPEEDLIDLSSDMPEPWITASPLGPKIVSRRPEQLRDSIKPAASPPPPKKPDALRSVSPAINGNGAKQPPPLPRKPSTAVRRSSAEEAREKPAQQLTKVPPPLPPRRKYRDVAKEKIGSVITTTRDGIPIRQRPATPRSSTTTRIDAPRPLTARSPILGGQRHPDLSSIPDGVMVPQRRIASSGSLSALRNRMSSTYSDDGVPGSPGEAGVSKKEFLWMQRLAKARSILERQGVMLRTWKTGVDAQEISAQLVQTALKDFEASEK